MMTKCDKCKGTGVRPTRRDKHHPCRKCNGSGWLGIDSSLSTQHRPGSMEKVAVLEQRYADGKPLFHPDDATCLMARMQRASGIQECSTASLASRIGFAVTGLIGWDQ